MNNFQIQILVILISVFVCLFCLIVFLFLRKKRKKKVRMLKQQMKEISNNQKQLYPFLSDNTDMSDSKETTLSLDDFDDNSGSIGLSGDDFELLEEISFIFSAEVITLD